MLHTPPIFRLLAHGDKPHDVQELLRAWEWDPLVVCGLVVTAFLYSRGLLRLWHSAAPGAGIRTWEACCFAAGWLALMVALVSPLHRWGQVLFSAHMVQHEILMLIAAPLIILGKPLSVAAWALPVPWIKALVNLTRPKVCHTAWRTLTHPLFAWFLQALALWLWHVPAFFQAAVENDFIHALQHLSFFVPALLFWWSVLGSSRRLRSPGMAVLYMFTTALHSSALGALITFAHTPWYPAYAGTTASWGLTPLEDQQLGGLIMWIPAGLVYVAAGLYFIVCTLRESQRRSESREAWSDASLPSPFSGDDAA